MPALSIWMIRSALLNAWVGFGLATLIITQKGQPDLFDPAVRGWVLAHVSLLLVGWMVQLGMGVAYWIFPRLPHTITQRGRLVFATAAFVGVNLGVWGYALGIILSVGWLQAIGIGTQCLAIVAYAYHIAPRVRMTITQKQASNASTTARAQ